MKGFTAPDTTHSGLRCLMPYQAKAVVVDLSCLCLHGLVLGPHTAMDVPTYIQDRLLQDYITAQKLLLAGSNGLLRFAE